MDTARVISERDIVMNRAAGYEVTEAGTFNQEWVSPTLNTTADGSLYLSVLDYAKWDAGLLAGKILKPESWTEVYQPVTLNSGKTYRYGFAWDVDTFGGQPVHAHGGSWQGFRTYFIRYLGDELSIAVLTNADVGNPERIARAVAGLFDPKLALPPGAPIEDYDPAVTQRVRNLLEQLALGKLDGREFTNLKEEDVKRLADYYAPRVKAAGALQELRLFATREAGNDREYHYRARGANGILDVPVTVRPDGKFIYVSIDAESAWDAPLQP
jgi:hypothetical protein